jgi:hypothetical protein
MNICLGPRVVAQPFLFREPAQGLRTLQDSPFAVLAFVVQTHHVFQAGSSATPKRFPLGASDAADAWTRK